MFRAQEEFMRAAQAGLRRHTELREARIKSDLHQERLAVLRAGLVGAVAGARLGLFDGVEIDFERAASAALDAGRIGAR